MIVWARTGVDSFLNPKEGERGINWLAGWPTPVDLTLTTSTDLRNRLVATVGVPLAAGAVRGFKLASWQVRDWPGTIVHRTGHHR
jgi:hypothetical protein